MIEIAHDRVYIITASVNIRHTADWQYIITCTLYKTTVGFGIGIVVSLV